MPHSKRINRGCLAALLTLLTTVQIGAQTPTNGLLSEYKFNSSAADAGPNGHHGILNGEVGFVADRFGNPNSAVSFNGGYIELGEATGLRFSPDDSFTISAWIYVETGSDQGRLYSSEDPTRNIHIVMSQQEIGARIFFYFGSAHIRSLVFEHDKWHHFSFIYDAINGTSLYWNGELVATDPVINNEYGSAYNTQRFGQQASPSYVPYIGILDHVVFHSRVLTVQEINQLRQVDDTQAPFNPSANLVAHWPFSGNALNSVSDAMHGEVIRANLSADRFGNNESAYEFDHVAPQFGQQYQEIYIAPNPQLDQEQITVSTWVRSDNYGWSSTPRGATFIKRVENGYSMPPGHVWGLDIWERKLRVGVISSDNQEAVASTTEDFPLGAWSHIGFSYDGDTLRLYLNGSQVGKAFGGFIINQTGSSGISIGESRQANGYWDHLDGAVDEVRIYSKALTPQEMMSLYQFESAQVEPSDLEWLLSVTVDVDGLTSNAEFGISPTATNGFDSSMDIPSPPNPPTDHVAIFSNYPEWNTLLGDRFFRDVKRSVDISEVPLEWTLTAMSTTTASGQISLTIPSGFGWPIRVESQGEIIVRRSGTISLPIDFVAFEPVSITIEVGDTTKPVVGIDERMNGPRVWSSDQTRLLQWSAQDANEVIQTSLDVSTTNGQSWERLSESMDTEADWTPLLEASSRVATRFRASATDRMLNSEIVETTIPLWLATPEQAVSAYSGWQLTGTPHSEVTRNAMPFEGVYRFDWNGQSYSLSDGFTALNGHWVGALATSVDTVSGTYSETENNVTVAAGWSILTTPVFASVSLDSVVVMRSETEQSFDEAIAEGLISGFYSFVDGAYELVTELVPFKAYWIGAQEEVTFMFPIHESVPVTKTNIEDPDLQLIVSSADSQQRVIMNVGASADIPAPPPAPTGYKIGLKGLETVLGDLYLIKHLEAGAHVEIPLQIQGPKRQVLISWPDQDVAGMTAVLVVGRSRYNLMASNSVSFTTNESQVYVEAGPISTSTEAKDGPTRTALTSIYPNPFNPTTRIQWEMAMAGQVQIDVYDMLGRRVVELVNDNRPAGIHSIELNARNLSSGIYQVRMLTDGQVNTRSITLIK